MRGQLDERLLSTLSKLNDIAMTSQRDLQGAPDLRLVIDNKNALAAHGFGPIGIVKRNDVPEPGALSTRI